MSPMFVIHVRKEHILTVKSVSCAALEHQDAPPVILLMGHVQLAIQQKDGRQTFRAVNVFVEITEKTMAMYVPVQINFMTTMEYVHSVILLTTVCNALSLITVPSVIQPKIGLIFKLNKENALFVQQNILISKMFANFVLSFQVVNHAQTMENVLVVMKAKDIIRTLLRGYVNAQKEAIHQALIVNLVKAMLLDVSPVKQQINALNVDLILLRTIQPHVRVQLIQLILRTPTLANYAVTLIVLPVVSLRTKSNV